MTKTVSWLYIGCFIIAVLAVWWFYPRTLSINTVRPLTPTVVMSVRPTILPTQTPFPTPALLEEMILSPSEFVEYYYDRELPFIEAITVAPFITNKIEVDQHIQGIAETWGYRLQRTASGGLVAYQGQQVQSDLISDWEGLTAAALTEGYQLRIVSGFRNIETQRSLFQTRFNQAALNAHGRMYTDAEIIAGQADVAIDLVLQTSSIPGYSKHHSGYVVDINDISTGKDFTLFSQSEAYQWLKENNYYQAKRFGFLPSYPDGGTNMGPEPEAWELVWVGRSR